MNKADLVAKARTLYKEMRFAHPSTLFMLETAINSEKTSEEDLAKLCEIMEKAIKKQDEIYEQYKEEMKQALGEYMGKIIKSKEATKGK
ncbi:hypothetical protein HY408_00875 [Candidatus Gottesmanbacteria bacterium]|nr:hypothetical protein [Candidatus Gottesmanbacteria bacterium]